MSKPDPNSVIHYKVDVDKYLAGKRVGDPPKSHFDFCAENSLWRVGESLSGPGSDFKFTREITRHIERIINQYDIKNVFDASCGDWCWMQSVNLSGIEYTGNDISRIIVNANLEKFSRRENVKFTLGDCLDYFKKKENNSIDLCIIRHTLEHLSIDHSIEIVKEATRVCKYAIITDTLSNETNVNTDDFVVDGYTARPISLSKSPFKEIVGDPIETFFDGLVEHDPITGKPILGKDNTSFFEWK